MSFVNNVTTMNAGAALSLGATGTTVEVISDVGSKATGGIPLDKVVGYGIQAVWTGTSSPVGTLTVQGSMDNTTWTTLSGSSVAVSGAGSFLWKDSGPWYKYVQVAYTRTSGGASDTVTCKIYKLTRSPL